MMSKYSPMHAASRSRLRGKKLLGLPVPLVFVLALAGAAGAAWILTTAIGFTGSGTTEAAETPIVLTAISANEFDAGTTGNLVCTATLVDADSFTLDISGADVDYNGADTPSDDRCEVTANVTIAPTHYLNGMRLVIDGGAPNDPVGAFALQPVEYTNGGPPTASSDFCGSASVDGSMTLLFTVTLSELNSDPGTVYDFAGSMVHASLDGSGVPCASAGL